MADELPLFDDSSLPPELDARVREELRDGERLLWVGQPDPRRMGRAGWGAVLFAIPWTAFALLWTGLAAAGLWFGAGLNPGQGAPAVFRVCFPLWGIPFILVGIVMLTSPLRLRRAARRTCYALTDQRAIIRQAQPFGGVEVRSYGPDQLTKLVRTEYPDGTGDLVFEEELPVRNTNRQARPMNITRYGFLAIENPRRIEELVRRVLLPEPRS